MVYPTKDGSLKHKSVSILGCGWLGAALAEYLSDRYNVQCLSRDIEADAALGKYVCDVLVIGIPPKGDHLKSIKQALTNLQRDTQIIHLSSVSYYKNKKEVIAAEELVLSLRDDAVVLRLGGLMGYDRIAGRWSAGKRWPVDEVANYIHRDDVIRVIDLLIHQNTRGKIYDLTAPISHHKSQIFAANSKKFGFEKTIFESDKIEGKHYSPDRFIDDSGYKFVHPDMLEFWDDI